MYQALYRKYRPTNFDEVIGQKIVVNTLKNAIDNHKVNHAYIFSGPRGTGKTSVAKIFAKTINCENPKNNLPCNECSNCLDYNNKKTIDIIEIDAASNNGVDEIRNLKSGVNLVPNNSKYKVYIIDEVHMLSTSAFNALLKTLEEPPKYVIFILATTELYKVPETIVSRCQNFDFHRISITNIVNNLSKICEKEQIQIEETALKEIAIYSNGGMRDAIGLLDQLSSYKNDLILLEDVNEICGLISNEQKFDFINSLLGNNLKKVIDMIVDYNDDGKNLVIFFEKIVDMFKNLLIFINASDYFEDDTIKKQYEEYSKKINEKQIYIIIDEINTAIKDMRFENNKMLLAQLCVIRINSILNNNYNNNVDEKKTKIANSKQNISREINNDSNKTNEIIELPNFDQFKEIRVNNALAEFNRKDLLEFKKKMEVIKDYVTHKKYASIVALLLDGELKAKGNKYIIYVYEDEKLTDLFNNSLEEIEDFMNDIFEEQFKMISVVIEDWEIIKKRFNDSLKSGKNNYILKRDIELDRNINESVSEPNNIDNMFSEIVKYKEEE